ncbi:hypothetical protein, partial [Pseudomonas syringae]|uniref:hypothetical protein n=1 Tax=Pseudomonas syringae TaxID=317 RepID=UPI0019599E74
GNENLRRTPIRLMSQNRCVTQSVTNCIPTLERGNENLSRSSIQLMSQNRRVTQSVTKGISVSKNATKRGTVAPKNGTLARPGTRDTSCNHSYRAAREPFYG